MAVLGLEVGRKPSAARAALDLIGDENAKPGTWWPRIQAPGIHNPPEKAEDTLAPIARAARALGM